MDVLLSPLSRFRSFCTVPIFRVLLLSVILTALADNARALDYIIDSVNVTGAQHYGDYHELEGEFKDTPVPKSKAPGATPGNTVRRCTADQYFQSGKSQFAPTGLPDGVQTYNIYYTCPNRSEASITDITWKVNTATGIQSGAFDVVRASCADKWFLIGQFDLDPDNGPYISFDISTANNGVPDWGDRFYTDAVRFELVPPPVYGPVTVTVDGIGSANGAYKNLADAVAFTNTVIGGLNVINVAINASPAAENNSQIQITAPVTINGDGESGGAGDGVPCDIIVDVATLQSAAKTGDGTIKSFLEIRSEGAVHVSDLSIHPNADGASGAGQVDAVHAFHPDAGTGTYLIENVFISGSDSATGAMLNPATTTDLYNSPNAFRWHAEDDAAGAILIADGTGAGTADVTLKDCMAAVVRGHALNISKSRGDAIVTGGLYAHAGKDCIRCSGLGIEIAGSLTNRVRVFNAARSGSGHGVNALAGATATKFQYIDAALTNNNASAFQIDGAVDQMEFCRGYSDNSGGALLNVGATAGDLDVTNCTFHAASTTQPNPVVTAAGYTGALTFTDSIFTSANTGQLDFQGGAIALIKCAVPTDQHPNESLNATPYTGAASLTDCISASPHYMAAAFDPASPTNNNWLRPSNVAQYSGVGAGDDNLTGGAGGTELPVRVSGFTLE